MLVKLRSKHVKKILWGLLCVIVPAFILWGGISSLKGRKKAIVGSIEGKKITPSMFTQYVKMAQIYLILNNQGDEKITIPQIQALGLDFLVLLEKAKQENIKVSDEEVINYIKTTLFPEGKFNERVYKNFLKYLSRNFNLTLTVRNFEEYVRDFIKINKLFHQNISVEVKEKEIKDLYLEESQKAKIQYLLIPYEKFKSSAGITSSEIEKFYQENKSLFETEPEVKINYILISKKDVLENVDLNAVSQIKNLQELSKELGLEIKETDFIAIEDPIKDIGWQPQINKVAFSLDENEISPILQTNKGLIVIEKVDEKPIRIPELNQIKDKVKEKIIQKQAQLSATEFAKELLDKIKTKPKRNKDWKRLARRHKIEFKETDYFKYNDYIEGLGLNKEISQIVFSLKENMVYPKPLTLENGIYIVKLTDKTDFNEEDYLEKKQTYRKQLQEEKEVAEKIKFINKVKDQIDLQLFPQEKDI